MRAYTKKKKKCWTINDKNGTAITDRDQVLERWAGYYEDLFYDERNSQLSSDTTFTIPTVTPLEQARAMNQVNEGKTSGLDGTVIEQMTNGGDSLFDEILHLNNTTLRVKTLPRQFNISELVPIYKKGQTVECDNYRGLTMLSHGYKLLMRILYNRISPNIIKVLPKTQAAYQSQRGTVEQIQSVQQVIEKHVEFKKRCHICFIDYTKAFDSIKQEKLWQTLQCYTDIEEAYIDFLKIIYDKSEAMIRTDLGHTRLIQILKGTKQGDILSAILFCLALSVILLLTFEGKEGVGVMSSECHTKGDDEPPASNI